MNTSLNGLNALYPRAQYIRYMEQILDYETRPGGIGLNTSSQWRPNPGFCDYPSDTDRDTPAMVLTIELHTFQI